MVPKFWIDVQNCRAALVRSYTDEDGSHIEELSDADMKRFGITNAMIVNAIKKAKGAIYKSGIYPISEEIQAKLKLRA
ncbi:MAG: hypothetical protein ACE14P_10580 [Methanotrichaceae archaeon]